MRWLPKSGERENGQEQFQDIFIYLRKRTSVEAPHKRQRVTADETACIAWTRISTHGLQLTPCSSQPAASDTGGPHLHHPSKPCDCPNCGSKAEP